MTVIARVCNRWTVELDGLPPWTGEYLTAQWLAFTSLLSVYGPDDIRSVFLSEHVHDMMLEDLFKPFIITTAPAASCDLYVLDVPDFTAWATKERMPVRALLDEVFSQNPKAVTITDSAASHLHLHGQRYESVLGRGTCQTYARYLLALLDRLEALYGYTLCRGYWGSQQAVLALVPAELKPRVPGLLVAVPVDPAGLELF